MSLRTASLAQANDDPWSPESIHNMGDDLDIVVDDCGFIIGEECSFDIRMAATSASEYDVRQSKINELASLIGLYQQCVSEVARRLSS